VSSDKKSFANFWRAVAWTVIYILLMWGVLRGLFNFDMFSVIHWTKLWSLELHGFAGLVFGILILAAVPLYVATIVLTVRTKTLPITIPLPKCLTEKPPVKEPEPVVPLVVEQETLPPLPDGVPAEMRETFLRAKKNYGARQMSVFNRPNTVPGVSTQSAGQPVFEFVGTENAQDVGSYQGMPIPTDFDIDSSTDTSDVPVFSDIKFDDDMQDTETQDENPIDEICAWLCNAGLDAKRVDDLIFANGFVIAVHDDDDFWVPDELDWFAAGKQKPSPIVALKKANVEQNLKPVLYFGMANIMDIDKNSADWTADGIIIVKDKQDLLNVLTNNN